MTDIKTHFITEETVDLAHPLRTHPGGGTKYEILVKLNHVPPHDNVLYVVVGNTADPSHPPACPDSQPSIDTAPTGGFRCFKSVSALDAYLLVKDFSAGQKVFAWLKKKSKANPAIFKSICKEG